MNRGIEMAINYGADGATPLSGHRGEPVSGNTAGPS